MKGNLKLLNGIKIDSPSGKETRPTTSRTREALINILGDSINDSNWLDLCSGSGVIGCEALQKGAARIVAIENQRKNALICKSNLKYIAEKAKKKNQITVICDDVIKFLKKGSSQKRINLSNTSDKKYSQFDFIYLDPPYKKEIYTSAMDLILSGDWVNKKSILICECQIDLKPLIPLGWNLTKQKNYGKSCLLFLTPILA